jgi:hypothetical protein
MDFVGCFPGTTRSFPALFSQDKRINSVSESKEAVESMGKKWKVMVNK